MTTLAWTVLFFLAVGLIAMATRWSLNWARWRGDRVITCPDSHTVEAVEVDPTAAAASSMLHTHPSLRLKECSRWPEKADCGQECLSQIVEKSNHCLFVAILADWYLGKTCVYCQHHFGEVEWHDHKPGLRSPEGNLLEWSAIDAQSVFETMNTHQPVCWDCMVAEGFRRAFPDRVTDREWKRDEQGSFHVN